MTVDIAQTAISALVVASVGIVLARLGSQRFEALEGSVVQLRGEMREGFAAVRTGMARLETRLDVRIDTLETRLDARIDALDAKLDSKIDALDAKLDSKIDALDAKFDSKIDALDAKIDSKIDGLRADLTQIALVVGARPARDTG